MRQGIRISRDIFDSGNVTPFETFDGLFQPIYLTSRGEPISRILSKGRTPLDDHSSWHRVAAAPLAANPDFWAEAALWRYPERSAHAKSLFGIAPGGACHAGPVASPPVGSYSTVSPLPQSRPRRSVLCGAIRQVSLPGRYPAPLLPGVRTFLGA